PTSAKLSRAVTVDFQRIRTHSTTASYRHQSTKKKQGRLSQLLLLEKNDFLFSNTRLAVIMSKKQGR
ncbi:hypothetical protein NC01_08600, partial [Streptococcus uberis]